jgi:acetyl-CoA carboxylase beta subunit
MVDMVVPRARLRQTIADLCRILTKAPPAPIPPPRQALPAPEEAASVE